MYIYSFSFYILLEGGEKVHMYHQFIFEEDETALMGNGLPNIMRDSQMSVCATTRMSLDNAGVTCGPMLGINTDLLRPDQDLSSISRTRSGKQLVVFLLIGLAF